MKEGTYVYNVNAYQKFSVGQYKQWLTTINPKDRF